jgi:hypothetical protein
MDIPPFGSRRSAPPRSTGPPDMTMVNLHAASRHERTLRRAHEIASSPRGRGVGALVMFAVVLSALSACGGEGANPFESDKAAIQPVDCAASAASCT